MAQIIEGTAAIKSLEEEMLEVESNPHLLSNKYLQDISFSDDYVKEVKSDNKLISLSNRAIAKLKKNINRNRDRVSFKKVVYRGNITRKNSEIMIVPTLYLSSLKVALANINLNVHKQVNKVIKKINEATVMHPEDEVLDNMELAERVQKREKEKVLKARKAAMKSYLKAQKESIKVTTLNEKRLNEANLNLTLPQRISRAACFLITVPAVGLKKIKDYADYNYGKFYVNYLDKLKEKEKIKSMKIADALEEANKRERRQDIIAAFLEDDLAKYNDIRKETEDYKNSMSYYVDEIRHSK